MGAAIRVRNFYWKYPTFTDRKSDFALRGINLEVEENETLAIIGRNGSGKTTLCSAMAGIIPYQAHLTPEEGARQMRGEISVLGKIISSVKGGTFVCSGVASPMVGLVMQDPESQFLTTNIRDELCLGLRFLGIPEAETAKRVREALEAVGLANLHPYIGEIHPSELSGGQKQRLIIACFIAMQPRILILDEPTSDLDPIGKFEVIDAIMRIKRRKRMTLIVVEQDPEVVCKVADRVVVLSEGHIVASGSPEDVFLNRRKRSPGKFAKERIGEVITSAKGVAFRYSDGVVALEGASLEVREGEFVGLIGQNGSGKTTLAQLLSGLEATTSGSINVSGLDLSSGRNRRRVHGHVGYVFQNPDHQLFTRRVQEEVAYGLRCRGLEPHETGRAAAGVLKSLGLWEKRDEDPIFLSRSEKRKLALASVLALKPRMIVADELLMGQDRKASEEIIKILEGYIKGGGAVVLITHDMRIVADHCPRSVVMKGGRILYDGPTRKFFGNRRMLKSVSLSAPKSVMLSE
jgi:energy-coupling factor transport system ATP-binding protein